MSNNQDINNWENDINSDNEGSKYDSESTEEIAGRNNVKQPKGLLNDSKDSITTNSGAKIGTWTNAKESSRDENDNEPAWYIDRDEHQDSSDNESILKESLQISCKFRRERSRKRRAAMASKKYATENWC